MDAIKYLQINQIISHLLIGMPELSGDEWSELVQTNSFFNNVYELGRYDQKKIDEEAYRGTIEIPNEMLSDEKIIQHYLRGYIPERLSMDDARSFIYGFREGVNWILESKIVK